jgi:hypothetical protein
MKAKERMERALNYEVPDRVPFIGYNGISPLYSDVLPLFPLTPNSWQPPGEKYYPHVDLMQLSAHLYHWKASTWSSKPPDNFKKWKFQPHKEIDEWGVIWEDLGDGTQGWPIEGPLTSWDQLDDLQIPDGADPNRFSFVRKLCHLIPNSSKFRMGLITNFLFERTHFLRGWHNFMRDSIRNAQKLRDLVKKIHPFYEAMILQCHSLGARAIFATDDWGSQEDVLINPKKFDEIYLDGYQKITKLCHELDMKFILHSCGNVGKLIPNLIQAGVDALEFDSPRMTGLEVMQKYLGKMCYLCVCNIQTVYPTGSPEDVEKETLTMLDTLANQGGGFIAIDYAGAESVLRVPHMNIKRFAHTIKKYGKYLPNGNIDKSKWPKFN